MSGLEVRELRYFVAVAEELNFSRAAERLGIAQPPLSRAIGQMERRLGVRLFERDTRKVTLTSAGRVMLDEARRALEVMEGVERRTRRAGTSTPPLRVTAKPGVASGLLREIVGRYSQTPGAAPVEITVSGYRHQADMVRDGRSDVTLLSSPYDDRGLDSEPLLTGPRVAALPVGHELARRGVLFCRDLIGQPMPRWAASSAAERLYWSGLDASLPRGVAVEDHLDMVVDGPDVNNAMELLEVVGLGQAVALIPKSLAEANPRPDIAYRTVNDASPYVLAIAWREEARDQSIALFVRTALETTSIERLRAVQ